MAVRTSFVTLCNNANLGYKPENGTADINFFFHQKIRNWYLGNSKTKSEKIFTRFNRRCETQNVRSKWIPLCT